MGDLQFAPEAASEFAGEIDALFGFLLAVSVFFSLLIAACILIFSIRFRRREGRRAVFHGGATWLEVTWTVVPLAITMAIFAWGARLFVDLRVVPPGAVDIYVTGRQWMWHFQHPQGPREINALHVPEGQAVRLIMTSEDVIHSLYIPALRIKQDVLPDRYSIIWFEPNKLGRYHLFCAEYCGAKHSEMIGTVTVLSARDYEAWLAGTPSGASTAERGAEIFATRGCNTCHGEVANERGPALGGLFGSTVGLEGGGSVVADEAYLRESIVEPRAKIVRGYPPVMPSFASQLSEEEILALIAYIRSLEGGPTR